MRAENFLLCKTLTLIFLKNEVLQAKFRIFGRNCFRQEEDVFTIFG